MLSSKMDSWDSLEDETHKAIPSFRSLPLTKVSLSGLGLHFRSFMTPDTPALSSKDIHVNEKNLRHYDAIACNAKFLQT